MKHIGDVRIRQADEQPVTSIPDEAPEVKLEGAPRTVRMLEEPEVLLSWEASDDGARLDKGTRFAFPWGAQNAFPGGRR